MTERKYRYHFEPIASKRATKTEHGYAFEINGVRYFLNTETRQLCKMEIIGD